MTTVIILVVVVIGAAAFYNMWLFDRLVRWEYKHHRQQWEQDGKPGSLLWRPEECKLWSSGRTEHRLNFMLLFKTPVWAAESRECRRWIAHKRIASLVAALVVLAVLWGAFVGW